MTLGGLALSFAIIVGGTLGSIAALRQNSAVDYFVTGMGALGLTIPNFVVAPIFQIVFGLTLAWLPVAGWANGAPAQPHPAGASCWPCRRSPSSRA